MDDWAAIKLPEGETGRGEVARMLGEVERCREILSRMLLASGQERLEAVRAVPVADHLRAVAVAAWSAERGRKPVPLQGEVEGVSIMADPMFDQAIGGLLGNAEQAAPGMASIAVALEGGDVCISVADLGAGFPPDILARPGAAFQSTKQEPGRGLGLYLVRNVMRRLGGRLTLTNTPRGACASPHVPAFALPDAEPRP